ncbi:hypothetical protein I7I53_05330 [Histoplasma capsulatum var. duboisii H88]|uniref:Uncharacterized protein n=1 Tax=Ajellomyces capsulatus (strain H88) TaxID=544711 RepID=A0A8A1LXR7_AJEC8|nr:hypothetical protein I7I53_05330 [Histoplasma capsulatum var. duboisii H88]
MCRGVISARYSVVSTLSRAYPWLMGISRPSHSVFVFPAFSGRISLAAQGFRLNLLMLFLWLMIVLL